jgi:uncharacterized protein (TIGR00725 family)
MKKPTHPNHTAVPKAFSRLPDGYGVVKIGVSGSADLSHNSLDTFEIAKAVGREIALQGAVTVTGATTGFPMYASMGAKDESGFSIGFSPAATEMEHIREYQLPREYMDVVVYTGFGYMGRDLIFVRACDAMIIGPGRIGTLNEFAVAFETGMPIGVLQGSWDTDELIQLVIEAAHRPHPNIIFHSDPKILVEKLIERVMKMKHENEAAYHPHISAYPEGKNSEATL